MKNTFANARENLSDEQLKHVTGGARINSRPEAAGDHLIDYGHLDLHGAAAAEEHPQCPPMPLEWVYFDAPVRHPGLLTDDSGHKLALDQIDEIRVLSNGEIWAVGDVGQHQESVELGNYEHDHGHADGQVLQIAETALQEGDWFNGVGDPILPLPDKPIF